MSDPENTQSGKLLHFTLQGMPTAEGNSKETDPREPTASRSVSASVREQLTTLVPAAVEKLREAIESKESWAIKFLLDAAGLERVASTVLDEGSAGAGPVISEGFERELIDNMLQALRNPSAEPASGEGDRTKTE